MNIVYIGNFRFPHCTEVHISKTMRDLGHAVTQLQEDEVSHLSIKNVAGSADLVLYTRTWGLHPAPAVIQMWRDLEAEGVVTASYHLDLYVGLARSSTLNGDPFWETGHVFTPDGDPLSENVFATREINHHWSPPAVFRDECVRGKIVDQFVSDVAFVGSYPYPHPEWPYRDELVGWCSSTYGPRFKRYGGGAQVVRNGPLNDLYRSAKVIVGDSLCPDFTKPNYWSDRLTETIGRGGCLVFPRVEGIEKLGFVDGEHLRFYTFGDFDELGSVIDELLGDEMLRRRIRKTGQQFVKENHTYHNRMRAAFEVMGLV